jgi:hypothetical protein
MIVTKGLGGGNGLIITQGYGWFSAGQIFDVIHGSIVRIRHFTETVPDRVKKTVRQRFFKGVVNVRKNH